MKGVGPKLNVGVTLHVREGYQSVWENGIFQNCAFLVQLLQQSPAVGEVFIINPSNIAPNEAMMMERMNFIGLDEAMEKLDVVIEMSALIDESWVREFKQRGGKLVWMRVGNDYVIDIERAMFNKDPGSLCSDKPYDQVWTIPEYENSCKDYFSLTTRAPVKFVPHLWTPEFFQRGIDTLPEGLSYGYQAGRKNWRVSVFEPNMCMVKTSFIPMFLVEEAYRANPAFLDYVRFCNTLHIKDNGKFVAMARRLDIVNHGLASFEGRTAVFEFMAKYGDAIVSHQWENAQNYLYYEALYGGYPLIHNSPILKPYGYYYSDFDCQEGGQVLLNAFAQHDARLEDYKREGREFLATLDVNYPANIEHYTQELLSLYER
ncbi:MAG: DUF2827 domain-containing protein [Formosimonas sp.]